MAEAESRLLKFRAYGPRRGTNGESDEVSAAVFASRLTSLVLALRAADAAVNGGRAHDYTIAKLQSSDPTALLREVANPRFPGIFPPKSGFDAFNSCVEAVKIGSSEARTFGKCARHVADLSKPAKFWLDYSAVWPDSNNEDKAIRLDSFLSVRARAAAKSSMVAQSMGEQEWFRGSVIGTFDGSLEFVDARGALPLVKLTLSSGGAFIDCVCRADHIDIIGASIKRRVRVTGRAIYDGMQGLPVRVEVTEIAPVVGSDDFTQWRGSFEPFEIDDWGDDIS
jgi:hypothetical protein